MTQNESNKSRESAKGEREEGEQNIKKGAFACNYNIKFKVDKFIDYESFHFEHIGPVVLNYRLLAMQATEVREIIGERHTS